MTDTFADPTPPDPARLTLASGETRRLRAPRGMRILNLGGAVLMDQPAMPVTQRLEDGESVLIEQATWVTLTACAATELVCITPTGSVWRRAWEAWHRARVVEPS